jgi:hypothetical protein
MNDFTSFPSSRSFRRIRCYSYISSWRIARSSWGITAPCMVMQELRALLRLIQLDVCYCTRTRPGSCFHKRILKNGTLWAAFAGLVPRDILAESRTSLVGPSESCFQDMGCIFCTPLNMRRPRLSFQERSISSNSSGRRQGVWLDLKISFIDLRDLMCNVGTPLAQLNKSPATAVSLAEYLVIGFVGLLVLAFVVIVKRRKRNVGCFVRNQKWIIPEGFCDLVISKMWLKFSKKVEMGILFKWTNIDFFLIQYGPEIVPESRKKSWKQVKDHSQRQIDQEDKEEVKPGKFRRFLYRENFLRYKITRFLKQIRSWMRSAGSQNWDLDLPSSSSGSREFHNSESKDIPDQGSSRIWMLTINSREIVSVGLDIGHLRCLGYISFAQTETP